MEESLVETLRETKVNLCPRDLAGLRRWQRREWTEIQGHAVEHMVLRWIQQAGATLIDDFPKERGRFYFEKTDTGILVYENWDRVYEFDGMCTFKDRPFVIEVKSGKLRNMEHVIENGFEYGAIFFQRPVEMLLFSPHNTLERRVGAQLLEVFYPGLHCIDLAYKSKELRRFVRDHYMGD